jgi:hypothetical protein
MGGDPAYHDLYLALLSPHYREPVRWEGVFQSLLQAAGGDALGKVQRLYGQWFSIMHDPSNVQKLDGSGMHSKSTQDLEKGGIHRMDAGFQTVQRVEFGKVHAGLRARHAWYLVRLRWRGSVHVMHKEPQQEQKDSGQGQRNQGNRTCQGLEA